MVTSVRGADSIVARNSTAEWSDYRKQAPRAKSEDSDISARKTTGVGPTTSPQFTTTNPGRQFPPKYHSHTNIPTTATTSHRRWTPSARAPLLRPNHPLWKSEERSPPTRGISPMSPVDASASRDCVGQFRRERRQIIGLAARYQRIRARSAYYDFFVYPRAAGVRDIGTQTRPRRQRTTGHHAGFDQRPWSVADYRDGLPGIEETPDERHRVWIHAEKIRVGHAPGQDESVVFGRLRRLDHRVHVGRQLCRDG